MNKEELKIICDTEDLYETCKNMEQLFDYYLQLAVEYHNLKQENKILRENAEHNDKVVDKVNWENNLLQQRIDKALHRIQLLQMDGEVTIKDLGLIVRDLKGEDK